MKVNIVIPMAGAGSRFAKVGYKKPKPFIDVKGIPMIARVMENLNVENANYILIARKEHLEVEKEVVAELEKNYPVTFLTVEELTEGAAITVLIAHRLINNENPLLIANSDQIVDIDLQKFIDEVTIKGKDGSIMTFKDDDPKWSYAKVDSEGHVTEVKEKVVISDQATVGIYLFKEGRDFVNSCLDMIIKRDKVNNEYYVCPAYNYSVAQGKKVSVYEIDMAKMHGIGTPDDLNKYLELI